MKQINIAVFALLTLSCSTEQDAEQWAEKYCSCMIRNDAAKDYVEASQPCDKEMLKNRYMRLWMVDMNDRNLDKAIQNDTRDSVAAFIGRFTAYVDKNCCKKIGICPDSLTTER